MRRYYFDLRDGDELAVDEEGLELSDLDAVQQEATRALRDMAHEELYDSGSLARISVEVRDDAGAVMRVWIAFEIQRTN
ncbi:DUF6894 family protein [Bradyrhizobium japonicum]|uniref:DUF6894 family protein n=1 Tax=Bradyrhizobium japonicum TaxID=375 RepID=UPI003B677177